MGGEAAQTSTSTHLLLKSDYTFISFIFIFAAASRLK